MLKVYGPSFTAAFMVIFFLAAVMISLTSAHQPEGHKTKGQPAAKAPAEDLGGTGEAAFLQSAAVDYDQQYSIQLTGRSSSPVSNHLMGFNLVYPQESDARWSDGKIEGYLRDVNTSLLRWPGGTVSTYYHWNDLTGRRTPWRDNWDPENPVEVQPDSEFMDLDQYMDLIRNTGATPLLGINVDSGRRWDRTEDGINEALALMEYCRENDFEVRYWYLGNEPYLDDSNGGEKTIEEYAGLINTYADAMREIDPDIKVVANWRQAFRAGGRVNEYAELLEIAGHNIDIIDVHWYWNFSNPNMDDWLAQTPMRLWTGHTYTSEVQYFRQMMEHFELPDIKLAALEWNVGRINEQQLTPHQTALIQSEMLMQFVLGGLDYATFWPIHWPNANITRRSFVDPFNNNAANPVYHIFRFMGQFQGGYLVDKEVTGNLSHVLETVVIDEADNVLRISFLNKNDFGVRVNVASDLFGDASLQSSQAYVLGAEGDSHELRTIDLLEHDDEAMSFVAPEYSITMLTFENAVISTAQEEPVRPAGFELYQNYPNPFNPETVISYRLPVSSHVRLEIFDMLGRRITKLVDEQQTQGLHSVTFDAGKIPELSSGMYIYRLQAGELVKSRSLMMLK